MAKLFDICGGGDVGHDGEKKDGSVIWDFILYRVGKSLLEIQCNLFLSIDKQSAIKEL